ncbi:hypothetical protein Ahy_B06g083196 [Arachis hypogaea]|uniref:Putative plant transposon protein domain-containing protein n=1 Tax=Arachis hypogaea TaxID=3818 RepID=A0A444YPN5_ARAHY|nr:hypothetical protein Ahy_B06g083196 [Arachis hypogaea]
MVASMVEAVNHLTSHLGSCTLSTRIVECGETIKELSEGIILKLQGEEEKLKQEIQQEEKIEISEQKEVVDRCLGYVELIKDVKKESEVEKVNGELKENDQEVVSITRLDFVDRDLGRVNTSCVREFYCNFFRANIDSVQLRGREIMITEDAIGDALLCHHRPNETCAYRQAEVAILSMTFDYEALKRVIATPDAPWVMDSNNKKPKGMRFAYLTREAKTWQHIFAHYVFPTTHFSEIPMDILVLIGCVMEGKEVNFPRLVRHSMWRAHICGLLPFPTLVTSMIELAGVPWKDDDVTPPPPDNDDKETTIP